MTEEIKIFSKKILNKKDLDFVSFANLMSLQTFIGLASSLDKNAGKRSFLILGLPCCQ